MISHFYAYISKIRWLKRWGLKRNTIAENVMEHSWEVSAIAHALALIKNRYFDGGIDAHAVAATALYHDCGEVITGDLPSPIKYHSEEITIAYKAIERQAERELLNLLPDELKQDYEPLLLEERIPEEYIKIVKAADTIAAFLKCQAEVTAGNSEFKMAVQDVGERLKNFNMPEVEFFLETFVPSCGLTLDELLKPDAKKMGS